MIYINLESLKLKTFTEQNALDYCLLNDINYDSIKILTLNSNELTDISGIKLFKNLESLDIGYNKITDISILKYLPELKKLYLRNNPIKDISVIHDLNKLEYLDITNLKLESDQIQYLNKNFKKYVLFLRNGFKDKTLFKKLNRNL